MCCGQFQSNAAMNNDYATFGLGAMSGQHEALQRFGAIRIANAGATENLEPGRVRVILKTQRDAVVRL